MPSDKIRQDLLLVPAADDHGREALPVQRVLQVVPHATVDGDVQSPGGLDRYYSVERQPGRRDHGPSRFYQQLDPRAEVTMHGRHEPLQVVIDVRGDFSRLVANAEPAAQVVDLEFAEACQRGNLGLELLQVQDLRADVRVQTAHVDHGNVAHPGQRGRHLLDWHTE